MPQGEVRHEAVFHPNLIIDTLREIAEEKTGYFKSIPPEVHGFSEWGDIGCTLETMAFQANFQLQQMPGCCAVLVLSYVKLYPHTQENFVKLLDIIEDAGFRAGFGSIMMTQVVPNYSKMFWDKELWIKCLDKGWKSSDPFRNAKSGNLVVYLTKDLGHKGKVKGLEFVTEL